MKKSFAFASRALVRGGSMGAWTPTERVPGNCPDKVAILHIELNKGGKRTFANFQAKTQYFRSRF